MNGIDLSSQSVISIMERIISKFESYSISVNKSSRFYRFLSDYGKLVQSKGIPDNLEELLEGMRDFFEIWQIAETEEVLINCKSELEEILGGARKPADDKNPLARNLQYQLFLASIFCRSEMNVRFEEPDFIFDYMGDSYTVAVKRITSKNKIKERIREAEKQILKYEFNGFIALSLDRLLDYDNPMILLKDTNLLIQATNETLFSLIKENFKQDYFVNRNDKIKGIILTLGIPSFTPEYLSMGFGYGFNLRVFPLADPSVDNEEFNRIGKITEKLNIVYNQLK